MTMKIELALVLDLVFLLIQMIYQELLDVDLVGVNNPTDSGDANVPFSILVLAVG